MPLTNKLRDVLEQNVDEKYYLNNERVQTFLNLLSQRTEQSRGKDQSVKCLGSIYDTETINRQAGKVYDPDGLCATITTSTGGNRQPMILEKEVSNAIRVGVGGRGSIDRHSWDLIAEPMICASRGRNPENPSDRTPGIKTEQMYEINTRGLSNTLTTVQKDNLVIEPKITDPINYRIRKLTPKECWRLMGFADTDIDKCINAGISNTQLYKQAGNSIVVNVLENLFKNILTILDR